MARTKQTARKSTGGKAPRKSGAKLLPLESPAPMTSEQQQMIAEENELRETFCSNPGDFRLSNPTVGLIDMYGEQNTFVFQEESPDEAAVPKLLTSNRIVGRTGPSVVPQSDFQKRWNEFTKGMFDGMDWNNVFVAGGAVLGCVMPDGTGFSGSDIDIFIYGLETDEQANRKLQHIHNAVKSASNSSGDVIRTNRAVTILGEYPFRHVQIILKLYTSPAEILLGFDVDSCCVGFDGQRVWASKRARRALNKGYNLVNMTRRSLTYETRLRKYSKRGFCVAVPDLDKSRVDPNLFHKKATNVQGLAKLLIFEYLEATQRLKSTKRFSAMTNTRIDEYTADRVDEYENLHTASDYSEVFIPWGPLWYSRQIVRLLGSRDRAQFFQQKGQFQHRHIFATGIDCVIDGPLNKMGWCIFCRDQKVLEGSAPTNKFVPGKLTWLKDAPAMQDFENGRTRKLLTGSFHPVIESDWQKSVYTPQPLSGQHPLQRREGKGQKVASPAAFAGKPVTSIGFGSTGGGGAFGGQAGGVFGAKPTNAAQSSVQYQAIPAGGFGFGTPEVNRPPPPSGDSGFGFQCSTCQATFFSRNKKYEHIRMTGHEAEGGSDTSASPAFKSSTPAGFGGGGSSTGSFGLSAAPAGFGLPAAPTGFGSPAPAPAPVSSGGFSFGKPASPPAALPSGFASGGASSGISFAAGVSDGYAAEVAEKIEGQVNPMSKCLIIVKILAKHSQLSPPEKGILKDLTLQQDHRVLGTLDAYEVDRDLDELTDTFKRICRLSTV